MRETAADLYPERIPEDLKTVIARWFDFRYVSDNEKFPVWFFRIIDRDYDRYNELLRIEPGIAQYDYLVSKYMEQRQDSERKPSITVEQKNVNRTVTRVINADKTRTETHSGTDTVNDDYTITHPTETLKTEHAVDTTHENYNGSTQTDVEKENPMSVSYQSGLHFQAVAGGDGTGQISNPTSEAIDWTNPTSQAQSGIISRSTDKTSASALQNYDNSTRSYTGTDKTERDLTTEHGHVITTREQADGEDNTDTTTYGGSVQTETTGTDKGVKYNRYAGRDEAPADILKRAAEFISRSSAFEWLYRRLDPCFISVYDYE